MNEFLNELEKLLTKHFGEDWSYDFDEDKPLVIHFPIKEEEASEVEKSNLVAQKMWENIKRRNNE